MDTNDVLTEANGLLQELGLKEYEAKCFVALSRLPRGTAKAISEVSDVPRTRVYDAVRVLESEGLVEVQHSNPQQFRAVPVEEAIDTLREKYESRFETLRSDLTQLPPVDQDEQETAHEVWSLSGRAAISNRTTQLLDEASNEVVFILGSDEALNDEIIASLTAASDRGTTVVIGTITEDLRRRCARVVPAAEVFVSELDWLTATAHEPHPATSISRLLLTDRRSILVSSVDKSSNTESAVYGTGFNNGFVVVARRLMATGLLTSEDPVHS
ncbi:MAG: TrmB family transcriptional regulator [Halopenitus sp.]